MNSGKILGIGIPAIFVLSIIMGIIWTSFWDWRSSIFEDFSYFHFVVLRLFFPILCAPFLYWFFFQRRRKLLGLPTRINGPNGVFFIIWAVLIVIYFILIFIADELFLIHIFIDGILFLLLIPFGICAKKDGRILDAIEKRDGNYDDYGDISEEMNISEFECKRKIRRFLNRGWLGERDDVQYFLNGKVFLISHPSSNILIIVTLLFGKHIFGNDLYYWDLNYLVLLCNLFITTGILLFSIVGILLFSGNTKNVKTLSWIGFGLYIFGRLLAFTFANSYSHYYFDDLAEALIASDIIIGVSIIFLLISLLNYKKPYLVKRCSIFALVIFCLGHFFGSMIGGDRYLYLVLRGWYLHAISYNVSILVFLSFLISFRRYQRSKHSRVLDKTGYERAKNYERAYNFKKALELYSEAGSQKDVQRLLNKLGREAENRMQFDQAIKNYLKAKNHYGVKCVQKKKVDNLLQNNQIEKAAYLCEDIGEWELAGKIRRREVTRIYSPTTNKIDTDVPPPPLIPRPPRPPKIPVREAPEEESGSRWRAKPLSMEKDYQYVLPGVQLNTISSSTERAIPDYTLTHKIGSGGFATVYKALDDHGNPVALKLPKFMDETMDYTHLKKFETEAEIWNKLTHDNIVEFYEAKTIPMVYLAIELMEGGSLKDFMTNHPLSTGEAVDIMLQILDGMSYAHRMATIHRDIKPENILFTADGTAKVSDWGIGKFMASEGATKSMGAKGTLLYSAPEQISKKKFGEVDWTTDVFQLGILFYEMLTGENLFFDEDSAGIVGNIMYEEPEPPSVHNREVTKELDYIVMRALEKKKEDRWRSADVMYDRLKELVDR